MKTQLKDRVLWYDGIIQVHPDDIPSLLLEHIDISKIVSTESNDDTQLYFQLTGNRIDTKTEAHIPKQVELYPLVDIEKILLERVEPYDSRYKERLKLELEEIKKRNMHSFICCIHYVIETLKKKNILWGVGRGSSCASLILYLLDVHMVDPVKYDIDLQEFFHD